MKKGKFKEYYDDELIFEGEYSMVKYGMEGENFQILFLILNLKESIKMD